MIQGKLVQLRAVEREDLLLMRNWRNKPEFRRNFREVRELNLALQEKWFQRTVVESTNDYMFLIERAKDKVPLGVCGLVYVNWLIRSADVSLYIGHNDAYIDKDGYAEEATRLLIKYAFQNLNLNKVWTELYEFDDAKINFFESLAFKRDGTLRANCFEDGKYWDSHIYSFLRSEAK